MIGSVLFLCALLSASFAVAPAATKRLSQTATVLHLEVPSVDPLVVAAGGLAVVGGVGTVVLTSKIREMDSGAGAGSPAALAHRRRRQPEAISRFKIPHAASGNPGEYETFNAKYEADAVADVKAKQK